MINYTEKIIAFIDILGFREHIKNSINNTDYLKKINAALDIFNQEVHSNYHDDRPLSELSKEVTNFSDSFIISYDFSYKSALFYVIMDLIHIQFKLAYLGFLVRGSITIGELYHDKDKIFGPAIVEAYDLESKNAIYPRIIMTKDTLLKGMNNPVNHHTPEMELEYLADIVNIDKDQYLYIDYIKQYQEFDYFDNYSYFLTILKKLIEEELDNNSNEKVLKKYRWLKKKYNFTIREQTKEVKAGGKREYKNKFLIRK